MWDSHRHPSEWGFAQIGHRVWRKTDISGLKRGGGRKSGIQRVVDPLTTPDIHMRPSGEHTLPPVNPDEDVEFVEVEVELLEAEVTSSPSSLSLPSLRT